MALDILEQTTHGIQTFAKLEGLRRLLPSELKQSTSTYYLNRCIWVHIPVASDLHSSVFKMV